VVPKPPPYAPAAAIAYITKYHIAAAKAHRCMYMHNGYSIYHGVFDRIEAQ